MGHNKSNITLLLRTLVACAVLAIFSAILVFFSSYSPNFTQFVILTLLAISLMHYLSSISVQINWPKRRTWLRHIRNIRQIFLISAPVRFCYCVTILFFIICLLLTLITGWTWIYTISGLPIALGLIISGSLDFYVRLRYAFKYQWIKRFFLGLIGYAGVVTLFISRELAQHLTQYITKTDPKNFPDFVSLATTISYPLALVIVVGSILLLLTTTQYFLVFILSFFGAIGNLFKNFYPIAKQKTNTKSSLLLRLIVGKNTCRDRPLWFNMWDSTCIMARPAATTMILITLIIIPLKLYSVFSDQIESGLSYALAYTEYRVGSSCKGVASLERIAYLENDTISIATPINGKYIFKNSTCEPLSLNNDKTGKH